MKKLISLLMIISIMMLSIGTAFAWSYETVDVGVNIIAEENADGLVTVTVKATDLDSKNIGSYDLRIKLDGVKLVNATDKTTEVATATLSDAVVFGDKATAAGWVVNTSSSYTSASYLKLVVGSLTAATINGLNDATILTMYFQNTGSTPISEGAFDLYTTSSKKSTISYSDATKWQSNNNAEYFGLKVVPYKAATVDKWETSAAPEGWTAPAALEGEVRRVAVFGKNATAKALEANSYGVTFGANTYYGGATTEAVNAWAIVLVDTEGDLIKAGYEYTGTAFVGTTEWPVTVSAN